MGLLERLRRLLGPSAAERAEEERFLSADERSEVDEGPEGIAVDQAARRRFDEPYPSDE